MSPARQEILIRPDRVTRLVYAVGGRIGFAFTALMVSMLGGLLVIGWLHGDSGAVPFVGLVMAYVVIVWAWRYWDSRTFALTINAGGVEDHYGRHVRRWTWDQVALLAWDTGYRRPKTRTTFAPSVTVCAFGDPRPAATFGGLARNREQVLALLRDLGRAGWPVDSRPWSASQWWDLDTRAVDGRHHDTTHTAAEGRER